MNVFTVGENVISAPHLPHFTFSSTGIDFVVRTLYFDKQSTVSLSFPQKGQGFIFLGGSLLSMWLIWNP